MTTNHIDTLAQWWDEAEEGVIEKGDTVINRSEGETTVYVATVRAHRQHPSARILARAPKPKPAWHNADFIVARYENDDHWQGYLRSGSLWIDSEGHGYTTSVLHDVTPLIEAKVTDEMVERLERHFIETSNAALPAGLARRMLTAALGLETA